MMAVAVFFAKPSDTPIGYLLGDFFLQAAPVMNNPLLNSTFGANFTNENLTCYTNATDSDGDQVTYRGFWFRNGKPYFYSWINLLGRSGPLNNSQPIQGVAVDSFDNIAAAGSIDIAGKNAEFFVVKYDENGTQLWNRSAGSIRSEFAQAVAVDSLNNIVAAGSFIQASTQPDVWIWKLNSSGTVLWNVTVGSASRPEEARGVAVDGDNNITVVGYNESSGAGSTSIYIWKYNTTGSQLWNKTIRAPGTNFSDANGVAIDSDNNITITGYMQFTMGMTLTPVKQVFTAKLTPGGTQIKNVTFNNSGTDSNIGNAVAIDSQDNIFVVGSSGFSSIPVAIIIKYDSNLVHQWNRTLNFTGAAVFGDSAADVAIDDEDNIYVTGTANRSIFLVKYDTNGNQLWNLTSSYDPVSQGRAIAIDSKNYIIIGGRDVNGSNDLGFVLKYYGFENVNQAQGVLVNSSTIPESATKVGDVWMCDSRALDATAKTTYFNSNNLTIRDTVPSTVECSINVPNNFSNCTNLVFFDNITEVRANCSGAVNATFNLTNLFDNTNFIYATTTTASGDFMVLDNADVQILDSGNWSLNAFCDYGTIQGNDTADFSIPFGNLSATMLTGSQNVTNGTPFTVTTRLQCVGGECVNNSVVLDPIQFSTNLTDATNAVHSVYADSEFIYGASEDSNLYIYNKTDLSLYATLSDANPLTAVYADSQYIYAGGTGQVLRIWNRTDYLTPFTSVYNFSGLGQDIMSIVSDTNNVYVGFRGSSLKVFNKTSPVFENFRNLTGPTDVVRDLAIDDTYLYAVTHGTFNYGKLFIYNRTNLSQSSVVRGSCSFCNIYAVSTDSNYIYTFGHDWSTPFLIAFYKSNFSVAYNNTNYFNGLAIAGDKGSYDFLYTGGPDTAFTDGKIIQANKTTRSIADEYNISNWWPMSLYCDANYLYAGMRDNNFPPAGGMISLFNNPCLDTPPVPITINNLSVAPSNIPVPSTAYCSANITTSGTVDNVSFTVTYPNGTVVSLSSSNVSEIFNSSSFTVDVTGAFLCNVTANNTAGTSTNDSLTFYGGQKGAIPMNSGSPFYTTSQNPRNGTYQSCLQSLIPGVNCDSSWSVVPNGTVGQTYFFFGIYNGNSNTNGINITIGTQPTPPPPTPSTGGTGGGGSQYVNVPPVQEIQAPSVCVENWACGDWSDCEGGVKTRSCYDYNSCKSEKFKPVLSEECVVPESVVVQKIVEVEGVSSGVKLKTISAPESEVNPLIVKLVVSALVVFGIILLLSAVLFIRRPSAPVDIPLPKMEKFEFRALTKKKN